MTKKVLIVLSLMMVITLIGCGGATPELEPEESSIEELSKSVDIEVQEVEATKESEEEPKQVPDEEPKEEATPKKTEPKEEPKQTETTVETPETIEEKPVEEEPKNPYDNVSLNGVHIATIDGVAHFAKWVFDTGDADIEGISPGLKTSNGLVCFTDAERSIVERKLTNMEINYTVSSIPIDPLLLEIVEGKTFGSRTEAINYIESLIAGTN